MGQYNGVPGYLDMKTDSAWALTLGGKDTQVFAGVERSSVSDTGAGTTGQGMVVVLTLTSTSGYVPYLSPEHHGALTIVSVTGPAVTLDSAAGTSIRFDVATRTWEP
jgi:hypothetical protein